VAANRVANKIVTNTTICAKMTSSSPNSIDPPPNVPDPNTLTRRSVD
jgi:hypothetical protein